VPFASFLASSLERVRWAGSGTVLKAAIENRTIRSGCSNSRPNANGLRAVEMVFIAGTPLG